MYVVGMMLSGPLSILFKRFLKVKTAEA